MIEFDLPLEAEGGGPAGGGGLGAVALGRPAGIDAPRPLEGGIEGSKFTDRPLDICHDGDIPRHPSLPFSSLISNGYYGH